MRAANKRSVTFAAAFVVLLLLVGACGADDEPPTTAASPSPSVVSPVTGLIVEIESEGFGEVTSFVLKAGDDSYEIFIARDVDYGFPLSHLNAHRVGSEPVVVELELRDGRLFALSIEDA